MKAKLILPKEYSSKLNLKETERGIKYIKDTFEVQLSKELNLERVSAPLFLLENTGLNDDLNGVERPVTFDVKETEQKLQVIHSLAKWKRFVLKRYNFELGCGIYADMNAIRRDENLDNLHSLYVDQWDWEKVISQEQRCLNYLNETVHKIIDSLIYTQNVVCNKFENLTAYISPDLFFISTQELEDMYPNLTPKEREDEIAKKYKTVFIFQIGKKLNSGIEHDLRAPDYDDWNLNGDILVWYPVINKAVELSSMGIRVDKKSLLDQLKLSNCEDRKDLNFHKMLLNDELPLTIGGGIGQSRICMILLNKAHIGEVQASTWPKDMIDLCKESNIELL